MATAQLVQPRWKKPFVRLAMALVVIGGAPPSPTP